MFTIDQPRQFLKKIMKIGRAISENKLDKIILDIIEEIEEGEKVYPFVRYHLLVVSCL